MRSMSNVLYYMVESFCLGERGTAHLCRGIGRKHAVNVKVLVTFVSSTITTDESIVSHSDGVDGEMFC